MKNKVILITGGTSGLGAATAKTLASLGAKIVFCGRREKEGLAMQQAIASQQGEATFVQADVTNEAQVARVVDTAIKQYGRLDAAFNNAGANLYFGSVANTTAAQFTETIQVNLTGTFYALKHELQAMQAGGGSILNTASTAGVKGVGKGIAAYVAAKHGVIGLTKAAALEYAAQQVRVNALVISAVATAQWLAGVSKTPGMQEKIAAAMPLGRIATVEEVVPFIGFLLSDNAKMITGAALAVDGGVTA